jgi:uncharacterized cupin superfamily protein
MPNITGNLKGKSAVHTQVSLSDTPEHALLLTVGNATQTSNDEHFNNVKHTSWGTADLTRGHGQQHGYFMNEASNGDRSCGTFECKVSTVNGLLTMEGSWTFTHGTGQYSGITGNGKFHGRMTSPTDSETSYEGSYQLKAGTRAA